MKSLADKQISSDATNLFGVMKPLLANMLGQFGQGHGIVCFSGIDPNGVRVLDPKGSASFSAQLHDTTFNWRLPLGSLLPIKHDMQTGEKFPGSYIYNPFTGNKLIT